MITLLLVGDDPLARSALAAAAVRVSDIVVVEEREIDRGGEASQANVTLLDLGLETRSALERARSWIRDAPPVVALLRDEESTFELLAAGARGILFRGVDASQLAATIRAVAEGLVVIAPELIDRVREARNDPDPLEEPLTPREREVLELLAMGLPNKQIADRLGISDHTVKFHVNALTQKLGAQSRTDAVVRAARLGLILL